MKRLAFLVLCSLTTLLAAQQPAPRFEVASVKPNNSDAAPFMNVPSAGTVMITSVPLLNIVTNAHGVPPFRIVGAPGWIARERFDISARIPDNSSAAQIRLMLQSLLADRFKLMARRETREQPLYAVVVARADGRLGPRLKASSAECASTGSSSAPLPFSPESPCGVLFGVGPAGGRIVSKGQPLARVMSALSMAVSRGVVDRTGLQGPFDVDLQWSSDAAPAISDSPSIFTALQEQLGLRFEPTTGPIDVLVIESVERPTPD